MLTRLLIAVIGTLSLLSANAQGPSSQGAAHAREFGLGAPRGLSELPPGRTAERIATLPLAAQMRAREWLQGFSFPAADLEQLRVDDQGGIYYRDDAPSPQASTGTGDADDPVISNVAGQDVFFLHSKPGASNVVFLDFDGHVITATAWNGSGGPLFARPYNIDSDPSSFSATERDNIAAIWHRVAEDLAPFDIDVTTEEPLTFSPTTGHVLITQDEDENDTAMPAKGAGGVAYVNVWGRTGTYDYQYYSPALVYFENLGNGQARYVAEAASHELGHNLALSHDGTASVSYYSGHNAGPVGGYIDWAPIMGNSYGADVSQWSRGDYAGANNLQDDLAVIADRLQYDADDHGDTPAQASALVIDAAGNVFSSNPETDPFNDAPQNKGIIEQNDDVDYFALNLGGGAVDLTVTPAWDAFYHEASRGANLDVHAALYDAGGNLVAEEDPFSETDARISASVTPGLYYLAVMGVGAADPVTSYDDYASLGLYFINGTVSVGTPNESPSAGNDAGTVAEDSSIDLFVLANDSDPEGDLLSVASLTQPAHGSVASDGTTVTYTPDPNYFGPDSFAYTVTDGFSSDSATVNMTVSAVNDAPDAVPDSAATDEGVAVAIDVLANDSDVDGDSLSVTIATFPANGSISESAGVVTYTPGISFFGTDSFQYSVDDGMGGSDSASVSVAVNEVVALPDTPSGVTASDTGQSSALVEWTASAAVDGYDVQRESQHKKRATWHGTTVVASTDADTVSVTDASGSGTFRYRVRAFNAAGTSAWSAWEMVSVAGSSGGNGKGRRK